MTNFLNPVSNARITSPYGYRINPIYKTKELHKGVDLVSKDGVYVPIYASADGIVVHARTMSGYGNVVIIKHEINGKRIDTVYAHLKSYSVRAGQEVKQGQQIAVLGNTGDSTGPHLHFEVNVGGWKTGQPNAVDPMKYISLDKDINWFKKNKGGLTMTQYNELKQLIEKQQKEIESLKKQLNKKLDAPVKRNVSSSHKEGFDWAVKNKLTNGNDPQNYLSREQLFTVLKRFHDKIIKK